MTCQLFYHLIHWTVTVKWDTNIRNLRINLYNIFDITCKQGIKLWRLCLLASLICACLRYPSKLGCRKRTSFRLRLRFLQIPGYLCVHCNKLHTADHSEMKKDILKYRTETKDWEQGKARKLFVAVSGTFWNYRYLNYDIRFCCIQLIYISYLHERAVLCITYD